LAATEQLLERGSPHSVAAERAVLGSILLDNQHYYEASEVLGADDFFLESHRRIYGRIRDLMEASKLADILTVSEELRTQQHLESVGGIGYVVSLTDGVPHRTSIEHYVRIVREKSLLRRLINIADASTVRAREQSDPVEDIIGEIETAILQLSESSVTTGFKSLAQVVKSSFGSIDELYQRGQEVTGLPTGYPAFDRMTSGLQPSDLVIIAARPSMGKTAFAINIAENAAVNHNKLVGIFSLEMSAESLLLRMLASNSSVDSQRLRTGFIGKDELSKLARGLGRLVEAPIFLDDSPAIQLHEMRAKARRLKHSEGRLDLIIVDYLQLISGTPVGTKRFENRTQEVSAISRGLKALAKELRVPVIAVSQLSRAPESRGGNDRRPQLSDLRESGSIEQDADVVAFLFREEYYMKPDEAKAQGLDGIAELIIGKQRNGPTGTIRLAFRKNFTRFDTLADERDAGTDPGSEF